MLSARGDESPSPSDADLLARLGARETTALAALYERHAPFALGVAHRVLRVVDAQGRMLAERMLRAKDAACSAAIGDGANSSTNSTHGRVS